MTLSRDGRMKAVGPHKTIIIDDAPKPDVTKAEVPLEITAGRSVVINGAPVVTVNGGGSLAQPQLLQNEFQRYPKQSAASALPSGQAWSPPAATMAADRAAGRETATASVRGLPNRPDVAAKHFADESEFVKKAAAPEAPGLVATLGDEAKEITRRQSEGRSRTKDKVIRQQITGGTAAPRGERQHREGFRGTRGNWCPTT